MTQDTDGIVRVRLRSVAVGAVLLATASLTALVIVVSVRGADLLSVVALALAVIAFAAQLIIYIVQATESNASTRRALELHSELSGLLAELRERTGSTQRSVETMNVRLLEAIIGKEKSDSPGNEPESFARRVAESYAEVSSEASSSASGARSTVTTQTKYPPALSPEQARQIHEYMSAWPEEGDAEEIEGLISKLTPSGIRSLFRYADDAYFFSRPDARFGPGVRHEPELEREGLIEKVKGWKLYTLSEKGRRVGRVFTAEGNPPEWASPFMSLREAEERRLSRLLERNEDNRDPDDV